MYQLASPDINGVTKMVIRLSDRTFIMIDGDGYDCREYRKWLEEGNEPLPADE